MLDIFGIYGIYFFLKLMLFFAIVKALVKFEALQDHFLFLGVLYTSLVALISYVFVVSTRQFDFQASWLSQASRATGLSPWLCWLAATLILSTLYFKLISKFDEGSLFWILLVLGIPLAFF
jgi:hypothetical protein